ncbi:MAG: nucleotidyl transferase AbiEii/AbiGii toxin family protein [Bradymonadales bacterium]|nr:MAG: nucleotidyl transferase AbiEii/AbiGii toxin family protein [Bradymonadales bacterium]
MTSIHQINQQLKSFAEERKLDFNEARIVLAIERLMARLQTDHELSQHLVFKGGFILLRVFGSSRFTRDLDALASRIETEELIKRVKACIRLDLEDHFWFGDEKQEDMVPDDPYGTVRFNMAFQLGPKPDASKIKKLSRIHFDIGFGDVITPKPTKVKMESLVSGLSSISAEVYPIETVLAEKLDAFVARESLNSRAKDLLDLVRFLPDGLKSKDLKSAIERTFSNRGTEKPSSYVEFAKSLDLQSLRSAWPSVKEFSNQQEFNDVWTELLKLLEELDNL